MKRFISLLAAALLIFAMMPTATAEEDVILRLVGGSGNVGDTVTVTAFAENAPDCTGYSLTFTYDDTVLMPIEAQKGQIEGLADFSLTLVYEGKPAIRSTAVDPLYCFSGDVVLATFTFKIIGETSGLYGTSLPICHSYFTKDEGKSTIGQTRKHGRVYVGEDEQVTTAQAVEILRYLIGFPTENEQDLDWNGDGDLSVADAVLLLRELN